MDSPWWHFCEKCGDEAYFKREGPVYFEVMGGRFILCKKCAVTAWEMEDLGRIVGA